MSQTPITPWVRDLLRCPQCLSELRDETRDASLELVCTGTDCGLTYPVTDGIPVLLVNSARRPAG